MSHNKGKEADGERNVDMITDLLHTRKCAARVSSSSKVLTVQEYWPDNTG